MKTYWAFIGIGLITIATLKSIDFTDPITNQPLPVVEKHYKLKSYISAKWNIPHQQVSKIVDTADNFSPYTFPNMYDTLAVIAVESSFRQYAVSYANAKGLMQILYKSTSFDVENNIIDGTVLLRDYYTHFNSEDKAIESYNVGIGNYKKGIRNKEYLSKVKQHKQELENIK